MAVNARVSLGHGYDQCREIEEEHAHIEADRHVTLGDALHIREDVFVALKEPCVCLILLHAIYEAFHEKS